MFIDQAEHVARAAVTLMVAPERARMHVACVERTHNVARCRVRLTKPYRARLRVVVRWDPHQGTLTTTATRLGGGVPQATYNDHG